MKKLNERELKLLILAVVIIGGGSLFKWGIKPVLNSYHDSKEELVTKKRQWANKKRLLQESTRYKKALQQAKGEVQELNSLIFSNDLNAAQLQGLNILTTSLEKSGLKVKNKGLRFENKEDVDYKLLYYDFTLTGSFIQLTDFLKGLNEVKKLFIIEKLQLRKVERSSQLEINLMVKGIKDSN
ncbi:hypothetical protein [Halanaerobacter jeridensis]|uniref:Tfp pilus assembly protein PilO n=1 Tax=Halanaerobacter jeridensis TaxID=706427 RepID=A0A938XU12_9FIRM|nr:hypothetical protein [Halanaerobacter jeridensis]MBM7557515.1 Tfp pilus assembly protein PilO [Halanaerobacter jeridensis]